MKLKTRFTNWVAKTMFSPTNENVKAAGLVEYKLFDGSGKLKEVRVVPNLITNDGFDFICDAMGKAASRPAVMDYIAIGSSSTAASASQSALISQLFRKSATYTHTGGTKIYTLDVTFTAGEGTGAVQESGMFNAATGGNMLNRQTFPVINKGAADSLQVTWQITLS